MLDFPSERADSKQRIVLHLAKPIQWRSSKKHGSYPDEGAVNSCYSLAREKPVVLRRFDDSDISVNGDKPHGQDRSKSTRKQNRS